MLWLHRILVVDSALPSVIAAHDAELHTFIRHCGMNIALHMQIVKADVVLASHEALAGDSAALRTVNWECIVLDQRDRLRSSLSKAAAALHDVPARHRLLLSHSHPRQVCNSHLAHVSMLSYAARVEQAHSKQSTCLTAASCTCRCHCC